MWLPNRLPLNLGEYLFLAFDARDNRPLFSYGFGFGFEGQESWTSTSDAVRLPFPRNAVQVSIKRRTKDNRNFTEIWSGIIDPAAPEVQKMAAPSRAKARVIFESGHPSQKVDIVIIGDGYIAAEHMKFEDDASRATEYLFSANPFKENRESFNVRSVFLPSEDSGITSPLDGIWKRTALASTYNSRGIERRIEPLNIDGLRDAAAIVPYDYIIVITNTKRYGGAAEFRQYSIGAIDSAWSKYLIVHEFGHNFAGLADEYFTLADCNRAKMEAEPWKPNITASTERASLKWGDLVSADVPIATPWNKGGYVEFDNEFANHYFQLRKEHASEVAVDNLIREVLPRATAMLESEKYAGKVGAFEGASNEACGLFRPEANCTMFTLNPNHFCAVCSRAIMRVIQYHTA
ncbi:MAG: M64 family metallopeptidase [Pseudomonadota bacterium]|nr:M64 family metallopeptidase [Pseudomonadota bacterium]